MFLITSILRAGGMMLVSLVLGAIFLGYCGYYYPEWLDWMLSIATDLKIALTNPENTGISSGYNIWLKFLIHEQTFVLMFFVLMVRIVIVFLAWLLSWLFAGSFGRAAG